MKRNTVPSYLQHKQSGQARAVWTDTTGVRREKLLPGPYNSLESKSAYARLVLEASTSAVVASASDPAIRTISVAEVLEQYLVHASRYYVHADGKPTAEVGEIKYSIRPVRELYGLIPAVQFGPLALRSVRERMIRDKLCRTLINHRLDRVKRAFKWGVAEELVPPSTYEALRALPGLRRGRSEARESEPVKPVEDGVVEATLPFLPPHVRSMVQLMRFTGMRPSEVCGLTLGQIDRSGETWLYRPRSHKTSHHGKDRVIPFGPNARAALVDFLKGRSLDPESLVFSPIRQREERFAAMRKNRASKVQPSQKNRRKSKPKKVPATRYVARTIAIAVGLAAVKAGVPHWFPYQLRHAHATRVRKGHGLEAAQVLLGHSRADTTEIYAERNLGLAVQVAEKIG